jgi:ABC-type transport system involved in cytochrome bd biosynthesis fused ATPase/permease subunit
MIFEVIMEIIIPFYMADLIDLGISGGNMNYILKSNHYRGDGGSLPQGQRQLLSIARAAVADPPVMIMDEATSSIDTRTETLVQKGMDGLMQGRTVFVIADRPRCADC